MNREDTLDKIIDTAGEALGIIETGGRNKEQRIECLFNEISDLALELET